MLRCAPVVAFALLQAQQSEATVCTYPGGECYDLQLQKWKDGSWTLHGLWPEWKQDCHAPAFDYNILTPILPEMEKKWPSLHENKEFWEHEWSKHGSCSGMDQLTFFKKGLAMRDQYMSQCQGGQDCAICFAKDLATIETCSGGAVKISTTAQHYYRLEAPSTHLKVESCRDISEDTYGDPKGTCAEQGFKESCTSCMLSMIFSVKDPNTCDQKHTDCYFRGPSEKCISSSQCPHTKHDTNVTSQVAIMV